MRTIGPRGVAIAFDATFQCIGAELPEGIELDLLLELSWALGVYEPHAAFLEQVASRLAGLLRREDRPLLLDRSDVAVVVRSAPQVLPCRPGSGCAASGSPSPAATGRSCA